MLSYIRIPGGIYRTIQKKLLPVKMKVEEAAFVFAEIHQKRDTVFFDYFDWYYVKPEDYEIQSSGHIELKDDMRPRMIKRASDSDTAIIEIHSHVSGPARFSGSDFIGFSEFVPHVRWRLKNRPYAAIVLSKNDFDALVWVDGPEKKPELLAELRLKRFIHYQSIYPNGLSIRDLKKYE